jgi:hypothetical protein
VQQHDDPPRDDPPPPAPVATTQVDAAVAQVVPDAAPVVAVDAAAVVATAPIESPPPTPPCDADNLRDKGTEYAGAGNYKAALDAYDRALACAPSQSVVRLAFLAACQAGNATRAKELYAQIPALSQGNLAQICLRNKIDVGGKQEAVRRPEPPPPTLNQLFQQNRYADIVNACTQSFTADRATICVLSACHAHDAVKAKKWLRSVPASKRTATVTACHTAGTTLEPAPTPPTPQPKKPPEGDCDPNDLTSCQHAGD